MRCIGHNAREIMKVGEGVLQQLADLTQLVKYGDKNCDRSVTRIGSKTWQCRPVELNVMNLVKVVTLTLAIYREWRSPPIAFQAGAVQLPDLLCLVTVPQAVTPFRGAPLLVAP